jgi:hypothetical protein
MKISQVEWSEGAEDKGDRRTVIIRSVTDNNHFVTESLYFWH